MTGRRALPTVGFLCGAAIAVTIAWLGPGSDSAVAINRVEVPLFLVLIGSLPWLTRRLFGPARGRTLAWAARAAVYAVAVCLVTAMAVEAREGQKLGSYFTDGGIVRALILLLVSGYVAIFMTLTAERLRMSRPALAIGLGAGAITGIGLFLGFGLRDQGPPLSVWAIAAIGLPALTGLTVTRVTGRDGPLQAGRVVHRGALAVGGVGTLVLVLAPPRAIIVIAFLSILPAAMLGAGLVAKLAQAQPATVGAARPSVQGWLAAVCATATATLLATALTTLTIAIAPQRVPLQNPPPPSGGGCETCGRTTTVIPRALRHEYWVGISVTQATVPYEIALILTPLFALFAGGLGVGLAGVAVPAPRQATA